MNTGKIIATMAVTFLLLIAMALLPQGIAAAEDAVRFNQEQSASLLSFALNLTQEEESPEALAMRLLAMEQNMASLPIPQEAASKTEQEVEALARQYAEQFIDAYSVQWYDPDEFYLAVQLTVEPDDYSNTRIFWTVSYVQSSGAYRSLFMHIDDKTGRLLYINWDILSDLDEQRDVAELLKTYANLYFRGLGLERYQELGTESMGISEYDNWIRYDFTDESYGQIRVVFVLFSDHFTMYFLDEDTAEYYVMD